MNTYKLLLTEKGQWFLMLPNGCTLELKLKDHMISYKDICDLAKQCLEAYWKGANENPS